VLKAVNAHVEQTIRLNRRSDGLYHSYNTMKITGSTMEIEYLQEMLEGQVAVLSSGMLSPEEALEVLHALKSSSMFEKRQYSYMLYPDKELLPFCVKNRVSAKDVKSLAPLISRTGSKLLAEDCNGVYHFNPDFRNARVMDEYTETLSAQEKPAGTETEALHSLYENTFKHQSFTGRSGTFYAYEGLGSIYWHMAAKLLLAVQENVFTAIQKQQNGSCTEKTIQALEEAYYDVRKGISFNKTPERYGAFPCDPYSHTPAGQGAKQPGMTGQVKEEIITRWGELGVTIADGRASFMPVLLHSSEFRKDKTLDFTWCGVPVTYHATGENSISVTSNSGGKIRHSGTSLTEEETAELFSRTGKIKSIEVWLNMEGKPV